jgi:hypothetical protein
VLTKFVHDVDLEQPVHQNQDDRTEPGTGSRYVDEKALNLFRVAASACHSLQRQSAT